jgi:hypothetical protein
MGTAFLGGLPTFAFCDPAADGPPRTTSDQPIGGLRRDGNHQLPMRMRRSPWFVARCCGNLTCPPSGLVDFQVTYPSRAPPVTRLVAGAFVPNAPGFLQRTSLGPAARHEWICHLDETHPRQRIGVKLYLGGRLDADRAGLYDRGRSQLRVL